MKKIIIYSLFFIIVSHATAATYRIQSDGYLKAVEMDKSDTLIITLKNGQQRMFVLSATSARPVFTYEKPDNRWRSARVYTMECDLLVDGQPLHLQRMVSAQQSFYEPCHINGVTLFFDAVKDIDAFIHDTHGSTGGTAFPRKDGRFALIEMGDDFASQPLMPWYPNQKNHINIEEAYEGADTWLGGFRKTEAHNGMDVNVPNNTRLWAPVSFDDQYYFNSLARGDNNNRWMGIRNWPNGEQWILRSHHMTQLHVAEHTSVKQGTEYGEVGGTHFGSHPHVHFYFIWKKNKTSIHLDPWIIFWKIFENNKKRCNALQAEMQAFSPVNAGQEITFDARQSVPGVYGSGLEYVWSVNDGAFYQGETATHTFLKPGMYVVTLLVTDGADSASLSQHITVKPGKAPENYLRLYSPDGFDFKTRTLSETDLYGKPFVPNGNYLNFHFRKRADYAPEPKTVIIDANSNVLRTLDEYVEYLDSRDWLAVERHDTLLSVSIDKKMLSHACGNYQAKVTLFSEQTDVQQHFYVEARADDHRHPPRDRVMVDDTQVHFYPSRFFWVQEPLEWDFLKGYGPVTFWGGGDHIRGIARYQPELKPGRYRISLHEKSTAEPQFAEIKAGLLHLQINTAEGLQDVYWQPQNNRIIGTFELLGGKNSYVDVLTQGSKGQIYLDALVFERL